MRLRMLLTTAALGAAALSMFACPGGACEDGEERCNGDQVEVCAGGAWGDAEDCDEGMTCQAMNNGIEHCMGSM